MTLARKSQTHKRKAAVRSMLAERDINGIMEWSNTKRSPERALFSVFFDTDPILKWRAIEALAALCEKIEQTDPEKVKEIIRRILWQMNDESGGLIREGAEAIAVICMHLPHLAKNYANILVTYLVEEPFERGAHWAVATLSKQAPELFEKRYEEIEISLKDPDPYIRAHAFAALCWIHPESIENREDEFKSDNALFEVYSLQTGTMETMSVSRMASDALEEK